MFDSDLDSGALAFLQQAYRNNWQQYVKGLNGQRSLAAWDHCILTASNEQQAQAYRTQLDARQRAGLLPRGTRFRVIPDPGGTRIGSGGATLRVLSRLAEEGIPAGETGQPGAFSERRVLIIHSGGDSKRLPHCSARGKLFARVPHELPDGRASSLFDEFLVSLSGLPAQIPPGVLIASGDVLLLFDHLQLSFRRPGISGVAALAPSAVGQRHGVYVRGEGSHSVRAFLHKPSAQELAAQQAVDAKGRVAIDTGLVWLDPPSAQRLAELEAVRQTHAPVAVNLYGDLLAPMAERTTREAYLADRSDGVPNVDLVEIRAHLWDMLRGTPYGVEVLEPATFIHFGTTREYIDVLQTGVSTFADCGWQRHSASWVADGAERPGKEDGVAINTLAAGRPGPGAILLDAVLEGDLAAADEVLVNGLNSAQDLALAAGVVVDQLPLKGGDGYVTRIYGVEDNPKQPWHQGSFLNVPWPQALARLGIDAADLWPDDTPDQERTLWNAALYPVASDREESLAAALWLQAPSPPDQDAVDRWRRAERLSLAGSYRRADVGAIVTDQDRIAEDVRVRRFVGGLRAERPASDLAPIAPAPGQRHSFARAVADQLEASIDPWLPLRGYQALATLTGEGHWEQRAFSSLARLVRAHSPKLANWDAEAVPQAQKAVVKTASRIDFGGGWTDTPPYSLERGGTVLNAAIKLWHDYPITVTAECLDEPGLELVSRDIEAVIRPQRVGDVTDYANPADPFALHKAALVFQGLVPHDARRDVRHDVRLRELFSEKGYGLRLTTDTDIPRGSGLGTSSILAGAMLACLASLFGRETEGQTLYDQVLCLEQMITTGGGWQDQVGGLMGGIKLIRTASGLPQTIEATSCQLTPRMARALASRLMLVYTGQRRLAKNLLRGIMGRWMARDPEMVAMLHDIAQLAEAMHESLLGGNLDRFGALIGQHWEINKRMDPGSTNPFIDQLLAFCQPYISGAKLAGAGGGGFAIVIARSAEAAATLARKLQAHYGHGKVAVWPCEIAREAIWKQVE